ncbi:MAG: undecaprenyl phosphate translocase family protein, partial [Anaerostipes hadrus]
FIMSLDYLMSGTKEERIEAIKFLIRIGIGWVVGMGAAVSVLASIFDDRIYEISSLFLGLIIFAIPMICKEEKDSLKGKYQNIIWAVIGVVLVAAITYFNPVSGKVSVLAWNI